MGAAVANERIRAGLYSDRCADKVQSHLTIIPAPPSDTDTDVALFAQGYITLTMIDGDLSAGAAPMAADVMSRLNKLALPKLGQ